MQIIFSVRHWARLNGVSDGMPLNECRRFLLYRSALILALLFGLVFTSLAHAAVYHWDETVRACYRLYAEKWQQQYGVPCVSCSEGWQQVTHCAAAGIFPTARPQDVNWCIDTTDARYRGRPMSEDRVSPAMTCIMNTIR